MTILIKFNDAESENILKALVRISSDPAPPKIDQMINLIKNEQIDQTIKNDHFKVNPCAPRCRLQSREFFKALKSFKAPMFSKNIRLSKLFKVFKLF